MSRYFTGLEIAWLVIVAVCCLGIVAAALWL